MADMIHGGLLLLGGILLLVAIWQYQRSKQLVLTGIRTQAIVIENVAVRMDDGISYKPRLEFVDFSNTKQYFDTRIRSNPPQYSIGEKVNIIYEKENPENAKIIGYWNLYLATIILLVFASPLIIIGGGYFLFQMGIL